MDPLVLMTTAASRRQCTHRRRSRGGGQGDRSPHFQDGIIPPTFCCNIGKKYQNLLIWNCIIFSAKLIFFWGQAPKPPTGEGRAPPQTPLLQSSQYLSPTFNLTSTPLNVHSQHLTTDWSAEKSPTTKCNKIKTQYKVIH